MRFSAIAPALMLLSGAVMPAEGAQGPAKASKPQEEPRYLQATVIDVAATVVNVTDAPRDSPTPGVHLAVSADPGHFDVYLGPRDYLDDFEIVFRKGDRIQVIGSKLKSGEANLVLAREVRRGVATVYLRNLKGEPYWSAPKPPGK